MPELSKILIANRGEIACRIIRSVHALGYRAVAVYSEADADAPHVAQADQAVCIGPAPSRDSYLKIEAIVAAARRTGADAVHPGYGFLAENADFAAACDEAGLTWIGPPAEAIRLMGDKAQAKERMRKAGVPVIPGYHGGEQDPKRLVEHAEEVGYPLLIKAVAGGGGRGMRAVRGPDELQQGLASARSEAQSAFGNGDLLLEKLIEGGRHVEIQVFADTQGNTLHLGERECSAQRRHQKIIEEAPSLAVDAALRKRMGDAAVAAARAIGYVNAGTVEFILGPEGSFYFLEMNTRLQVEHPVTELVTGLDLVAWQLWVAAGAPLPMSQQDIGFRCHAIEARIYAEDPCQGFLPQTGEVLYWRPEREARPGVRVDDGVREGQQVTAHYDPMLAKVLAAGETREIARRKLIAALEDNALLGLTTNRRFLIDLLGDPEFVEGEVTTSTIDERFADEPPAAPGLDPRLVALAAALVSRSDEPSRQTWRNTGEPAWPVLFQQDGAEDDLLEARLSLRGDGTYLARVGQEELLVRLLGGDDHSVRCVIDEIQQTATYARRGAEIFVELAGVGAHLTVPSAMAHGREGGAADARLVAPLGGSVVKLEVAVGDRIEAGQCVAVIEAMKMEHRVLAGAAGKVAQVAVAQGDQVTARQLVVELELDNSSVSGEGSGA